jgi:hypothetical protein
VEAVVTPPGPTAPSSVPPPAQPALPPPSAVTVRLEHPAGGLAATDTGRSAPVADTAAVPSLPPAADPARPEPGSAKLVAGTGALPVGQAPAKRAASGSKPRLGALTVAVVLVIAVGAAAGVYWTKFRGSVAPAEPTAVGTSSQSQPELPVPDVAPSVPVSSVPPPAIPPAPVTTSGSVTVPETAAAPVATPAPTAVAPTPGVPKRAPRPKPAPSPAGGRGSDTAATPAPPPTLPSSPVSAAPPPSTPATERPAAAPLPDLSFRKVKIVTRQGDDTREADVMLMFLDDRVAVSPPGGGATLRSVRYLDVTSATYAREQKKRLFIKNSKHLLTIETAGEPLVLRLDNDNFNAVIRAFEARAQKTVER